MSTDKSDKYPQICKFTG